MRFIGTLFLVATFAAAAAGQATTSKAKKQPDPPPKVDVNNAFQIELEKLPGITRLLAKKIIANRPYEKVDDLARAGVPKETIEKIRPLVRAEGDMPSNHPALPGPPSKKRPPAKKR